MVRFLKKFYTGDKVFAKVRGYPPWPAKIQGVIDANTKNAKYKVHFYGTGETAVCKVEELFIYSENKAKFSKPLKRKFFHEGLQQLEQELKNDRTGSTSTADSKGKGTNRAETATTADSDLESGPLVIDEGDKKKTMKRKSQPNIPNTPDVPDAKKKRGRAKATSTESTPKQDAALDSQGEESSGKEVVSRSGRKIKPKRFADFSSSEETETTDKNGTSSVLKDSTVSHLTVEKEVQTALPKVNEKHTRFPETDETRDLTTKELKRLVLLEQLHIIRLQKAKFMMDDSFEIVRVKAADPKVEIVPRNTYGASFKLAVANFASKRGNRAAQRKYGINERCVRRWRSQVRALSLCEDWRRSFSGPKTGRNATLEDTLADYVKRKLSQGITVSCLDIKWKALEVAREQGLSREDFRASHTWVINFKHRHGFTLLPRAKEHPGRGRGKGKSDESGENQTSVPAGAHKKRAILEKRNNVGEVPEIDGIVVPSSTSSGDTPCRFLLARTFTGDYVGIKLDVDRPKSFENEKARSQWEWSAAREGMKLKAQLESGEILPEQVKDLLDFNVQVPEDEKRLSKDGALLRKKYKLRWLRIESQLLQLDAQIKSNLGLDRANADKCLQAMDDMLGLPIDPLMLKKHPHIVETVKRLRRYIGNLADWKLGDEEVIAFKQKAEQIRQKAEHIYNKFKAMFVVPEGQSFWQSFSDQVVHFKELTKDMPEEKMFSLMADPACPDPDATMPLDSSTEESAEQPEAATGTEVQREAEPDRSATLTDPEAK